jgi:hypothetical protein
MTLGRTQTFKHTIREKGLNSKVFAIFYTAAKRKSHIQGTNSVIWSRLFFDGIKLHTDSFFF